MLGTLLRSTGKPVVAIVCAAFLVTMSLGSVSRAVADDTWETWPRKQAATGMEQKSAADANGAAGAWETWPRKQIVPGMEQKPATATDANGAANPGGASEKKTATGRSYGTFGWIALGIAAVIGISIAAGGSGGGDGGGTVTNPGHQ